MSGVALAPVGTIREISKLAEINMAQELVQIRVGNYYFFYRMHLHVERLTFLLDRGVGFNHFSVTV
jgi:hypothetical protein